MIKNPYPFRPARTDNRWNTGKVQVAYASDSVALAAMEILTYWGRYATMVGYRLYSYKLKEEDVLDQEEDRPEIDPLDTSQTRPYGDDWAKRLRSVALRVPSVVLPLSDNYLIQPDHPDFDETRIAEHGELTFDHRILEMVDRAK